MIESRTQFLLIVAPFILMIMVKVSHGSYSDVFAVPDWSMAAVVIYFQSFLILLPPIFDVAKKGVGINSFFLLWHLLIMILVGLLPSFYVYTQIISLPQGTLPSVTYQIVQMGLFIFACVKFFHDHNVVNKLKKAVK